MRCAPHVAARPARSSPRSRGSTARLEHPRDLAMIPRTFGESPVRSTSVRPTSNVRSVAARVDRSWIESVREDELGLVQGTPPRPRARIQPSPSALALITRTRRLSPALDSSPRTFDALCATRRGPTGALESKESRPDRSARAPARPRDDSADIRRESGEVHVGSSDEQRSFGRCPRRSIVDRERARRRAGSGAGHSASPSRSHSALALSPRTHHSHSATVPSAGFESADIRRAVRHTSRPDRRARVQGVEVRPLGSSTRETSR